MATQRHEIARAELAEGELSPRVTAVDARGLAFLAEASAVLASSLDYEATLARVARLAVPELADWCVVDLGAENEEVHRVAVACADRAKADLARALRERYPARPDRPEGTTKVLQTGRAELIEHVSERWLEAIAPSPDHLRMLRRLGLRSNIIVPLIARGRTLGALTLATAESGRTYGRSDLTLAEELAARAAMAVDNARLFREAEQTLAALDTLLATAPVGLAFWDRDLRYVRINDTLAAVNGLPPQEHVGRRPEDVLPDIGEEVAFNLRRVLESGEPILDEEIVGETPAAPGDRRSWLASYYPVRAPSGETIGVGAVVSDITERRRAERRLAAQHAVAGVLAESPSLTDAAPRILRAICESLDWDVGAFWRVDDAGEALRCTEVWYGEGLDGDGFANLSRRLALPPGAGLPGRVWSTRRAAWVADVSQDPSFLRIEAAAELALRSWLAFPAIAGDDVLGVVEFFSGRIQQPDSDLLQALAAVGGQIGDFGARKRAEEERLRLLAREHVARSQAEEAERRLRFLADASAALASSLDYDETLAQVARLALRGLADWCAIDIVEDGKLRRLALEHKDAERVRRARELDARYPSDPESDLGPPAVIRTGRPQLLKIDDDSLAAAARDEAHLRALRELGLRSYMCVPMLAPSGIVGSLTFASAESGRQYDGPDLRFALELAGRAALAVDHSRLFREAQKRAQAASVLTHVGDGVFLLDADGVVQLWNPAAEAITGLPAKDVVGRKAEQAIPGWERLTGDVPVVRSPRPGGKAATLPLELPDRELWLSISGSDFEEGTVYAFRDITEERAVERMKEDFVSTASHELRTPLAAIYGAGLTLAREDVTLSRARRSRLLNMVVDESRRLTDIVSAVLLASRLDSDNLPLALAECDPLQIADSVLDSHRIHAPSEIDLVVRSSTDELVVADADQLRQVLSNLVDNAVKYSPDGGRVEVLLTSADGRFRFRIRDEGIGIPVAERERVFERFYRLDPQLRHGVGGTGLGLYICRELVSRMQGRIWIEDAPGPGSVFVVELPATGASSAAAEEPADRSSTGP